jgi:hypothetical protein
LAGEVASILQQQPTPEDQGVAGTSREQVLLTPLKWQCAIPTELLDDLMLKPEVLKHIMDTHKELYNYTKLNILYQYYFTPVLNM